MMFQSKTQEWFQGVAVVLLFLLTALSASAGDSKGSAEAGKKSPVTERAQESGQTAKSGDLHVMARPAQEPTKKKPAAAGNIYLDKSFDSLMVVRRNADGSFTTTCVKSKQEARAFFKQKQSQKQKQQVTYDK